MSNEKAEIAIVNCTFEPLDPTKRCEPLTYQFIYPGPAKEFYEAMMYRRTRLDPLKKWEVTIPDPEHDEWSLLVLEGKGPPEVKILDEKKYRFHWHVQITQASDTGFHIITGRNAIIFNVEENFRGVDSTVTAICDYPPYMAYFKYLLTDCGQVVAQSTEADSRVSQNEQRATAKQQANNVLISHDQKTKKRKTNPGVTAHADAIQRLHNGQPRKENYYQWMKEYQEQEGDFTTKKSTTGELYRASVWKPYQKNPTGKI